MKLTFIHIGCLILMIASAAAAADEGGKQVYFEPGQLWNDANGVHINAHGGGILFYEGVYYWFGEHKVAGPRGNNAWVGVGCYSSKDLYNWKNEGIALAVVKDNLNHDIAAGCVLERPKVIYNKKTGKFVMWFHLELKGQGYNAARCGTAISDSPAGPYTYLRSFRPNAGIWPDNISEDRKKALEGIADIQFSGGGLPEGYTVEQLNIFARDFAGGQMSRDMTLFVDEDGAAYHIYASEENSTLHISRLSEDYLAPAGKYIRVFEGRYMEAPAMFKHNGRYYLMMSGCTGWTPNAARSAVADSIWGPWKELGNPCVGENSDTTFQSQSTCFLPVAGKKGAFIYMGDRWRPQNAIDGRYIWLPVILKEGGFELRWQDRWDLFFFEKQESRNPESF
jgi:beta-xylosidase